jgi:hypothetical protein
MYKVLHRKDSVGMATGQATATFTAEHNNDIHDVGLVTSKEPGEEHDTLAGDLEAHLCDQFDICPDCCGTGERDIRGDEVVPCGCVKAAKEIYEWASLVCDHVRGEN